jgi:rhodanese-related sulfurtransferase
MIGGFEQYYLCTIGNPTRTTLNGYWDYSDTVVVGGTTPPTCYTINAIVAHNMIMNGSCKLIVDVREASQYNAGHIVNSTIPPTLHAISIPWVDGSELVSPSSPLYGHTADTIIVYCQSTACPRSTDACNYLVNHGWTKVYNMFEGIDAWTGMGYPTLPTSPSNTFGYAVIGGSSGWWGPGNAMWGCKFTSPSSGGTITKISAYVAAYSGTTNMKAFVYAENSGAPGALLATSSEVAGIGTTASWIDFTINYAFSANTVYWLMLMSRDTHYVWWNSGGTNQMDYSRLYTYPNAPNPWGTNNNYMSWQMSIYATYTSP